MTTNMSTTQDEEEVLSIIPLQVTRGHIRYDNTELTKYFTHYMPYVSYVFRYISSFSNGKVIDFGPGYYPLELATIFVETREEVVKNIQSLPGFEDKTFYFVNMNNETLPEEANVPQSIDFGYCRHLLEDLYNPLHAFNVITTLCKNGYIETPSPLIEFCKGIQSHLYRGYLHHYWFVWAEEEDNSLHFLPKFSWVEYVNLPGTLYEDIRKVCNLGGKYWNTYYSWSSTTKPKIVMHTSFGWTTMSDEYILLLVHAIKQSIKSTNSFVKRFLNDVQHNQFLSSVKV